MFTRGPADEIREFIRWVGESMLAQRIEPLCTESTNFALWLFAGNGFMFPKEVMARQQAPHSAKGGALELE